MGQKTALPYALEESGHSQVIATKDNRSRDTPKLKPDWNREENHRCHLTHVAEYLTHLLAQRSWHCHVGFLLLI